MRLAICDRNLNSIMANTVWKSHNSPSQDPAIVAYESSNNGNHYNMNSSNHCNSTMKNRNTNKISEGPVRETGIIEKLLNTYGFICCCDREGRLFFHYTEIVGDRERLKVGDHVDFEMSYDRRTGKPVACVVCISESRPQPTVMGTVITTPSQSDNLTQQSGSISYEQNGACFFLPFSQNDVKNNMKLIAGAQVVFYISTAEKNGNTTSSAKNVQLPNHITTNIRKPANHTNLSNLPLTATQGRPQLRIPPYNVPQSPIHDNVSQSPIHGNKSMSIVKTRVHGECYQGVVCSMKESYGFIERADVVKEIFFHFSEFKGRTETDLQLGDDVEFEIQTRDGKEVAVGIVLLTVGSVIFEDIALEHRRGKVQKTLHSHHGSRPPSDPLAGRIVYETVNGPIEIPYGDKDQVGDFSLRVDDFVEFNIATDRRDKLQRATNITFVEDTLKVNGEKRETGIISTVKDGFGFITCAERDARMFFHFSEIITNEPQELNVHPAQEVQFTITEDPGKFTRQVAVRIKYLPKGSVTFETTQQEVLVGIVQKEPSNQKNTKAKDITPGIILYDVKETKQTIPYNSRAIIGFSPKIEDKVEFQICESRRKETRTAANVQLLRVTRNNNTSTNATKQGFIAKLKDTFGFIELADHNKEVFFHFSAFAGEPSSLELGDEVEFTLGRKTNKVSAETISRLPKGTVAPEDVLPEIYEGKVVRSMRIINPDQEDYPGLVKKDGASEKYQYGITSLVDKRDFLQTGETVKFQIANVKKSGLKRATNISAVRKMLKAKVESIKGQFGFLNHEVENGKKLFFHMSEVHDNADLSSGDVVEFVIVHNQRNGKYSATNVRKMLAPVESRPQHLISRLKSRTQLPGPRVKIIRQPKAPDGTKGFQLEHNIVSLQS